jgi:hypothetical protein
VKTQAPAVRCFSARLCVALLASAGVALGPTSGLSFSLSTPPRPSFAKPQRYAVERFPGTVAIGDVTGDGRKDLVTASTRHGVTVGTVSVLVNRGHGTSQSAI